MNINRIAGICVLALSVILPINLANAGERGVFNSKSQAQHELTKWEAKKMKAEFKSKFEGSKSGAFQKLGNNPWAGKHEKRNQHKQNMLQLSSTWGNCREFAYKQRGRCYSRGGDAYTCERYYDARVNHCNENF